MNIFKKKLDEGNEALENKVAEFELLESKFNELTQENLDLKSTIEKLGNLSEENESLVSEVLALTEEKEALEAALQATKEDVKEVEDEVGNKVLAIASSLGVDPVEDVKEDVQEDELSITEKIKTLNGAELTKFYSENRSEILKALKG